MKPGDEINNGNTTTGRDDGEGAAAGRFGGGMTASQATPGSESRVKDDDNDIP